MTTRPRIGVLALARETFDVPLAETLAGAAFDLLDDLDADLIGPRRLLFDAPATEAAVEELATVEMDLLLVLQVTFTDASMMQVIGERIAAPIALWAFPEERLGGRLRLNAFCGINLAGYALRRLGRGYRYLFADPTSDGIAGRVVGLIGAPDVSAGHHDVPDIAAIDPDVVRRADAVRERLAGSRVAVIGDHPDGFYPCAYDPGTVESLTGVIVERFELEQLFTSARSVPDADLAATRARERQSLAGMDDVDQAELDASLRLYPALRDLAGGRFEALAVRCWPEAFTEYGGAVCAPAGMMNEEMHPTACEADVYGAITALVLQWLSGGPALVADLIDVDPVSDTGVLWHCGKAPLSMADPASLPRATVHSNRRKPLLHEFPFRAGRVTIARLSQARGVHSLVVGGGEMLQRPLSFSGTAGVVAFDAPAADVMETVMAEGLEHHYGFTYGDVRGELRALAARWGIPVVEL